MQGVMDRDQSHSCYTLLAARLDPGVHVTHIGLQHCAMQVFISHTPPSESLCAKGKDLKNVSCGGRSPTARLYLSAFIFL